MDVELRVDVLRVGPHGVLADEQAFCNIAFRAIQNEACRIIYKMCTAKGNLYAVQKAIIRLQGGPDAGSVRLPMPPLADGDASIVREAAGMISAAIGKYC